MGPRNAGGGGGGVDDRPRFSWPFFLVAPGVGAVLVRMALALSQPSETGGGPGSSTASGCSVTPGIVALSGGSAQQRQEWSFEAGEEKWGDESDRDRANFWNAYAHGDCLIMISGQKPGEKMHLTGYWIAEDGLKHLWSIEEEQIFTPDVSVWWGGKLVLGNRLLGPTTDALGDSPQGGAPAALSNDFVLVCELSPYTVCSGWDWDGGAPIKRWTQECDGRLSVLTRRGLVGNTGKRAALVELNTDPSAKKASVVVVSLTDRSLPVE